MKTYLVKLKETYADISFDLECNGLDVTWFSHTINNLVAIQTDKSKEELEKFSLIESVSETTEGSYYVG